MQIPIPIKTQRLLIREFDPETDAIAMVGIYSDPEVMRFIPGGALNGVEAVEAELRRQVDLQAARGFSSWAVVERETSQVIGDAGFRVFEGTGDIELGYTFARGYWGHGYATEAASACLAAGLEHLDVPRIIAVVDVENEPSLGVVQRLGLERIGMIDAHGRPHVLFARNVYG